jgi:hypothetical protein
MQSSTWTGTVYLVRDIPQYNVLTLGVSDTRE